MRISAEAWATRGSHDYFRIEEMEGEYALPRHYNPEARYCKRCGKRLSGYNTTDECFHHPERFESREVEYRPDDKRLLGSVHNYAGKLKVAQTYGFETLSDFVVDFYNNVGSMRLLSSELGMSSRTSSVYMLRKLGVKTNPVGAVSVYETEDAYQAYKEKRGVLI